MHITRRIASSTAKFGAKADARLATATTAMMPSSRGFRSIRLVSHDIRGEQMHSITAPKVIKSPASRILTPNPADNSPSIAVGPIRPMPVTKLPIMSAVGA